MKNFLLLLLSILLVGCCDCPIVHPDKVNDCNVPKVLKLGDLRKFKNKNNVEVYATCTASNTIAVMADFGEGMQRLFMDPSNVYIIEDNYAPRIEVMGTCFQDSLYLGYDRYHSYYAPIRHANCPNTEWSLTTYDKLYLDRTTIESLQ